MFLWIFLLPSIVFARCVWKHPATMFPEELLRLNVDDRYFHLQSDRRDGPNMNVDDRYFQLQNRYPRRRVSAIQVYNGVPNGQTYRHNVNPVTGPQHSRLRKFTGSMNHQGQVEFSIVFDKTYATTDMIYNIVDIEPFGLTSIDLDGPETEVEIVSFRRDRQWALQFDEEVRIGVGVRSPCLPEHEIGRVYYYFQVNATYDLYHSYNNTLEKDNVKEWTSRGWTSTASLVSYPPFNMSQIFEMNKQGPCDGTKFESSLDILNTSQYTFWDIDTYSYKTDKKFIGHENYSTPRCHRRDEGNICVVLAKARLTFGQCSRSVRFYIEQSVSHIARMSRQIYNPPHRPGNFDVHRREPVPDHLDMRYDMCESRVCQYEGECHSFANENDALEQDGGIYIRQYDTRTADYMETVCTFEVVGFLDEIWSPHIYFRHWAGFNYTFVE